MAKLSKQNVAEVLRKMNAFYQPQAGKCMATPMQMELLLKHLRSYTKEVQENRRVFETFNDEARWALDMANWQQRLDHYQREIDQIIPAERETKSGCIAIYQTVTAPLLDGIYYEDLPGINFNKQELERMVSGQGHPQVDVPTWFEKDSGAPRDHPPGHSNPKPPDVVTPFSLGNQLVEYREHQAERLSLFWQDLKDSAKDLLKKVKNVGLGIEKNSIWIGVGLIAAAAVVGGGYLWYQRRKKGAVMDSITDSLPPRKRAKKPKAKELAAAPRPSGDEAPPSKTRKNPRRKAA